MIAFTGSGGSEIPDEFWDIHVAEQFGTTAWDVRENATLYDVQRIGMWLKAKGQGEKVQAQRARTRDSARSGASSQTRGRRPSRGRRR